jgi:HSP20 family protein
MPEMTRDFGPLAHAFCLAGGRSAPWQPPADVYRTSEGWLIKFELAGVRPDDIRLTARGCRLTLTGQRRDVRLEQTQHSHSLEISYNRFERTIELPCELDTLQIATDYCDGMLVVRLALREPAHG